MIFFGGLPFPYSLSINLNPSMNVLTHYDILQIYVFYLSVAYLFGVHCDEVDVSILFSAHILCYINFITKVLVRDIVYSVVIMY